MKKFVAAIVTTLFLGGVFAAPADAVKTRHETSKQRHEVTKSSEFWGP